MKHVDLQLTAYSVNRMVFQGLLNRLVARKHYLLAHTYLAQPQCEWFNKADVELKALNTMLHAKDEGSIQGTQEAGTVMDDGMCNALKLCDAYVYFLISYSSF